MLVQTRLFQWVMIASCLFIASIVSIQAEDAQQVQAVTPSTSGSMPTTMQKSMDPNVWAQMMAMMMNPQKSSSGATCALCHEAADVARFQKDFGPMMHAMWQPYKAMMNPQMMTSMMDPNAYMGMMGSMMNPAMYMNMMNPMMGMMAPMMGMMGPMMNPMNMMNPMGMMGPMMGMMNPMNMMNPMGMMGPMMGMMNPMNMMNPMGMMGPMMGMMNPMNMMNPMGMMGPMAGGMNMYGGNPTTQPGSGQAMDPKQHGQWFSQWTDMMKNFLPKSDSQPGQ